MTTYKVTRTYKHTEDIIVEAESKEHAIELTQNAEFSINHDDWLDDERVEVKHDTK